MLGKTLKFILLALAMVSAGAAWQQAQLSVLALSRIDPLPETRERVAEERYAAAARYLEFFMDYDYVNQDPEAQALYAEIEAVRGSVGYQASKLAEGLVMGTSDETIGQMASVITDLFVVGDIRDLTLQGINHVQGEEVDRVLVALATIGASASAAQALSTTATVGTAGAAAPAVVASSAIKGGTIALKVARKAGKLPPWLGRTLIERAAVVKRTGKLDSVHELLGNVYVLARTRGSLELLSQTRNAASLQRMATFAETFGRHAVTLYRIGGEVALGTARHAGSLGKGSIRLAATYGRDGLRVLNRIGAVRFGKYSARASKMAYKGDAVRLLARLLSSLPLWLLYTFVALGALAWVPWRRLGRARRWFKRPGPPSRDLPSGDLLG